MDTHLFNVFITVFGALLSALYALHLLNFSEYKKNQAEVKKAHEERHAELASEITRASVNTKAALQRELDILKGESVGGFSGTHKTLSEIAADFARKMEIQDRKDKEFWEEVKKLREEDANLKLILAKHYMTKPEIKERIATSNNLIIHQLSEISKKLGLTMFSVQAGSLRSGDDDDDL